jgi:epoxyqueuosine reductase
MSKAQKIKEKAKELGFELVGIIPADPAPDFDFFRWWLDRGYAGTMGYLKRREEKRGDPKKVLPGVKSVICCGLNYYKEGPSGHPIARYAWGDDYHEVVGERLKKLERFITSELDPAARTRSYVDTGPVLERSYAARAGLGWIGKNTCLINNGLGSYLFLGEILTTLAFEESEYDRPGLDQCGTCSKCLDACPTDALTEPYVLDSNRCISYLTIEYRGDFSPEQEAMVGSHLYGCDICQEVCPYNERIPVSPLPEFQPRAVLEKISGAPFEEAIRGSAMNRIKRRQWLRNLTASERMRAPMKKRA